MKTGLRTIALLTALGVAAPALAAPYEIARSLQVVYDPVSREVARQWIKVVDPHPELGLSFLWEPAAGNWPGVDAEGLATGPGTLTWRIPGTAGYDPRAVQERWEGALLAGAYDGIGVLTRRDGSRLEGTWTAGLLEGNGRYMDAAGTLYEGLFRAGLPDGEGTRRSPDGRIYRGGFADGKPHGQGQITLPGGQVYTVVMKHGHEISSTRPAEISDSTLSGLLKAQGGGDAGKVGVAVVIDGRMTLQQSLQYTYYPGDDVIEIFPADEDMAKIWAGGGEVRFPTFFLESTREDWLATRAFVSIGVATQDGAPVRFGSLKLVVDSSRPHLRPMLNVVPHYGCIGTRPDFQFENYGWGPVENPRLRVRFANPDTYDLNGTLAERPSTRWFDVAVSGFDQGTDVDLRAALAQAGVDLATLSGNRFSCPSRDQLAACKANLLASVPMGELAGYVGGDTDLATSAIAELTYDWTDADGRIWPLTEVYEAAISLARIEIAIPMAEMGDGGPYATLAPQFIEIRLQDRGDSYAYELPLRGNPNTAQITAQLQFSAERSSLHVMHVEAAFADGSIRSSKPIDLFFLSPRKPQFQSTIATGACFLSADY